MLFSISLAAVIPSSSAIFAGAVRESGVPISVSIFLLKLATNRFVVLFTVKEVIRLPIRLQLMLLRELPLPKSKSDTLELVIVRFEALVLIFFMDFIFCKETSSLVIFTQTSSSEPFFIVNFLSITIEVSSISKSVKSMISSFTALFILSCNLPIGPLSIIVSLSWAVCSLLLSPESHPPSSAVIIKT